MSDIKLFRIHHDSAIELVGKSVSLERSLQALIEKHMEALLGVRFLASEFSTGKKHGGRIDSLGLDENGAPVIIEYKRALNENVINQGLFYLDWLLDHRGDFELLVRRELGHEAAKEISWENTRVLCIAGGFTRFDLHAVEQIRRNIELIRYKRYGDDLLLLELVNQANPASIPTRRAESRARAAPNPPSSGSGAPVMNQITGPLAALYDALVNETLAFGDDIQIQAFKVHIAFRRLKTFMTVEPRPRLGGLTLYLNVAAGSVALEPNFIEPVNQISHWQKEHIKVTVRDEKDLEKALPLILRSYEAS